MATKLEWIPTAVGQMFEGTVQSVREFDDAVLVRFHKVKSNRDGDPETVEFRFKGGKHTAYRKAIADIQKGWRMRLCFTGMQGRDLKKEKRGYPAYNVARLMRHTGANSDTVEVDPRLQWKRLFPVFVPEDQYWKPSKKGDEVFGIVQGTITGKSHFEGKSPYRNLIVSDFEQGMISVSLGSRELEKRIVVLPKAGDVIALDYGGLLIEGKKRTHVYTHVEVLEASYEDYLDLS